MPEFASHFSAYPRRCLPWMNGWDKCVNCFSNFELSIKERFNSKQLLFFFFFQLPWSTVLLWSPNFLILLETLWFLLAAASSSQSFSFFFSVIPCFSVPGCLWIFWYFWYHEITRTFVNQGTSLSLFCLPCLHKSSFLVIQSSLFTSLVISYVVENV